MQILGKSVQTSDYWEIKAIFYPNKPILVTPYPYNYLVNYSLSLKLFC